MNRKKTKYLPLVLMPAILAGCGKAQAPLVLNGAELPYKVNSTLREGIARSSYQRTGYPSFYGKETHKQTVEVPLLGNVPDIGDESVYDDSGIKFYCSGTSTNVGSTNSIVLGKTGVYIDFTDVEMSYPYTVKKHIDFVKSQQGNESVKLPLLRHFRLEILNSYGSKAFFVDMKTVEQDTYDKFVVNKNGTSTTVTDENGIDPKTLGKISASLYNGSYTIKLTTEYVWIYAEGTPINTMGTVCGSSSLIGTLLIDSISPTLTALKTSDKSYVKDGSYVDSNVKVVSNDANHGYIYYRKPDGTNRSTTLDSFTTDTDGEYEAYSVDKAGNQSPVLRFYVDTKAPNGKLFASGKEIGSGSYVDTSFSYVASDTGSGIRECYYKSPVSDSFVQYSSGSILPNSSEEGWYEFYSVDKAGNESSHSKVYLETTKPVVSILRNGKEVYSDTIVGSGNIDTGLYFNEGDSVQFKYQSTSGVHTGGTFLSGTKYFLKKSAYPDDTYQNTIVTATGTKVTYQFDIVREKPYLTIGGKRYEDGAVIRFAEDQDALFGIDSVIDSGKNEAEISFDGLIITKDILREKETLLSAEDGEEKAYGITLKDAAGNSSSFTVIIDKEGSNGQWMHDEAIIEDGSCVNHPVSFVYSEDGTVATISKDGEETKSYASGTEIRQDGSYTIVLKDSVGNTSLFHIVIDTVPPKGTVYVDGKPSESGIVTSEKIYFTWDGDDTCLVNGEEYSKNTLIDEQGIYEFVLSDKAGNKTVYTAEIDRTAPCVNKDFLENKGNDDLAVSKWYRVSFSGTEKDFGDKADALDYAKGIEREANVKEHQLDDVSKFPSQGRIADNGDPENHDDEVRTGIYWSYKSVSNPDVTLFYFDENLLDKAIEHYAKEYVSDAIYSDGTDRASGVYDNSWNFDGTEGRIANGYVLKNDGDAIKAVAKKDDKEVELEYGKTLGEQLRASGVWTIAETDRAGNECSYQVIIDHRTPGLKAVAETYGSEAFEIAISEESLATGSTYYLKSFSVKEILSGDNWAEVEITGNGKTERYIPSDSMPTIAEAGKYEVKVFDRLGHSIGFTVYISGEEEQVSFRNNEDDTAVSIDISLPESYQAITSLEIYKDGKKMDGVSADKLHYEFGKGGNYKVVLKDNFGRTIVKEYSFVKALPQGVLQGVAEGGKTNRDVSFSYDAGKYFCEIYKDGEFLRFDYSGNVDIKSDPESSGSYEIRLINSMDEDNFRTYSFSVDCIAPDVSLEGVDAGKTTNGNVSVSWEDGDVSKAVYSLNGGEEIPFENGALFDKEGSYVVKVIDELENETMKTFSIDKTVDYSVTASDGKSIGGDATTSDDVIITANEEAMVSIVKDGETYPYSFGDKLTEEGRYLITVEDAYGNKNSFVIVIDKTVGVDVNVCNGGITNEGVTISPNEKVTVVVTKDGKQYEYDPGETISEEGLYTATITDAYGNSKTLSFRIVSPEAKTSIDYELGEGCEIVSVAKDGTEVEAHGNRIRFAEDGTYVVTFAKDGKTYSVTLRLDTTAPEITLNGVEDGGKADGIVTIDSMSEEGTIEVYKDGKKIDYELGQELKEYGSYEVVVTDKLGNSRTYSFTLKFQMNAWAITLIVLGLATAVGVAATIVMKRKRLFKK